MKCNHHRIKLFVKWIVVIFISLAIYVILYFTLLNARLYNGHTMQMAGHYIFYPIIALQSVPIRDDTDFLLNHGITGMLSVIGTSRQGPSITIIANEIKCYYNIDASDDKIDEWKRLIGIKVFAEFSYAYGINNSGPYRYVRVRKVSTISAQQGDAPEPASPAR